MNFLKKHFTFTTDEWKGISIVGFITALSLVGFYFFIKAAG